MSSDTNVGQLQTLLGIRGGGSDLLFGNLITVPIQQSLLYVRPVYVKAAGENNPPLLRKVVVQFNNAVKVADTLPDALKLFPSSPIPAGGNGPTTNAADRPVLALPPTAQELLRPGAAGLPRREQRAEARRPGHLQAEDRRRPTQDRTGAADPQRQRAIGHDHHNVDHQHHPVRRLRLTYFTRLADLSAAGNVSGPPRGGAVW